MNTYEFTDDERDVIVTALRKHRQSFRQGLMRAADGSFHDGWKEQESLLTGIILRMELNAKELLSRKR